MTAVTAFNRFKKCINKRLKSEGFRANGTKLIRKVGEVLILLQFQRSQWNSKDECRFTINVGISLDALRTYFDDEQSGGSDEISREMCHWHRRIGWLLPVQSDVWWTIHEDDDAELLSSEISTAIMNSVLPQLESLTKAEAFVKLWKSEKLSGLVEYQRLLNLARLLTVLGRNEEAHEVVMTLEQSSADKAWSAAATVDARELRLRLQTRF